MNVFDFGRCSIAAATITVALAGCGSQAGNVAPAVPLTNSVEPALFSHSDTFKYTGTKQRFKVPPGVKQIQCILLGGAGYGQSRRTSHRYFGGPAGRVYAVIAVNPGELFYVFVGGQGRETGAGGFNGGGPSGYGPSANGYGGGGASDIRQGGIKHGDRILVAGGGGGQGYGYVYDVGGKGGGEVGGTGGGNTSSGYGGGGGTGGTQSYGGSGGDGGMGTSGKNGSPGGRGQLGIGGNGGRGANNPSGYDGGPGGGGGGGYYGGGGGGGGGAAFASIYGGPGGGGGGGSSYIEPGVLRGQMWQGWYKALGNGLVVISWR